MAISISTIETATTATYPTALMPGGWALQIREAEGVWMLVKIEPDGREVELEEFDEPHAAFEQLHGRFVHKWLESLDF
jgi:hypothetical protein